jgi:hypothetical protein
MVSSAIGSLFQNLDGIKDTLKVGNIQLDYSARKT